ncbi:MAG: hypothetical protein QF384_22330 [Alphaproteobacteria bacterium]|jgi:hypothetical protein|nr:hypothetical protein [Alphaproteobacteria bacterium]MDP6874705.1 hypothetical protein [Alphaproteobacteria bacterium]
MLSKLPLKALFGSLFAVLLLAGVSLAAINFSSGEAPLPEETPVAVVEKFYEYISEAKIRGGNLLINEAYKLTSGAQSRTDRALFLGVVNRYPPGFKADVVESTISGRHAVVTIDYRMPSNFGGVYNIQTQVHLNVDEESNTWKLDFRGDTDDQDRESIAKAMQAAASTATGGKSQSQ